MRLAAQGPRRGRDRVRRVRAVDRRPPIAGVPGSRPQARPQGWPLSRRGGGRAVRRFRCLERAGRDLAPSCGRRAAGPVEYVRPKLGTGGVQRCRPRDFVVRAVSRDAAGFDALRRRDQARSRARPEASLSGAAWICRQQRRLCANAVRGAAGDDRAGEHGASLRGDRGRSRHRAGRTSANRSPTGASGHIR